MKTAFIFNESKIIGGGEISFLDLISESRQQGIEPVAFVPAHGEVQERLTRLKIQTVISPFPKITPARPIESHKAYKLLAGLLAQIKPDIVHVNGARSMLYAGTAARNSNIPCVWHVRVIERDKILDRIRARLATGIVVNSKAVMESLKPFLPDDKKTTVIYNGLDIDTIASAQAIELRKEFAFPNAPVILGAGRLTPWKGFHDLILACAALKAENIPHSCLIVGDALPDEKGYEKSLKKLVADLGLTNVKFAGWRDNLYAIMKSSDLFVLPSHGEPFGRVIIEAWACGLPVAATDEGGPKELITHGTDGILVQPGNIEQLADTIAELLADAGLRLRLAEQALKKAGSFTIAEHTKKIIEFYRQIM